MTARNKPLRDIEFQVLLVLADGPTHGYALLQAAERQSGGELRIEPATLYRALRRLTDGGLIAEATDRPEDDDPRRRYFALTTRGREAAASEARRMARLVATARRSDLLGNPGP